MIVVRLLLQLILLLFLTGALLGTCLAENLVSRIVLIVACLLFAWGIYALKNLHSVAEAGGPPHHRTAFGGNMMWSAQTPFLPLVPRHALVQRYPLLAPFYPMLSPGVHLIALHVLPVLAGLLAAWLTWRMLGVFWVVIYATARDDLGLEAGQLREAWKWLSVATLFVVPYVVRVLFRRRVPAWCVVDGCGGHAFLHTERDLSRRTSRFIQFVYVCREHRHRHPTGVMSLFR